MDTKIFLQKFRSKKSSNTSSGLNVEFKGKRKLLPLDDVGGIISQYEQYAEERKNCNIIRLTCQVNPICSNVLFNKISEIIKGEGSSAITFLNYGVSGNNMPFDNVICKKKTIGFWSSSTITDESSESVAHPTNAIRDMQLSRNGVDGEHFVYHCGIDIFNNHLLRSKTFKTVCTSSAESDYFNTIGDMMRNVNGNTVTETIYYPVSAGVENNRKNINMHLYEIDDIDTFNECVETKLVKKYNGWLGFYNKSKIKSYKDFSKSISLEVERPLMYENGGNFIDMYPTRELFSFIPIYNSSRERIEKNWNYCITYPSSSYTPSEDGDPFSDVIECNDGLNSLKAIYFDENTRSDNGSTQLVIYGIAKHGLKEGDYVNIYKTYDTVLYWVEFDGKKISDDFENETDANDEKTRINHDYGITSEVKQTSSAVTVTREVLNNAEVSAIVDDYIFTVLNSDVQISNNWIEYDGSERLTINGVEAILDASRKFYQDVNNIKYYVINDSYINIDKSTLKISFKKVVNDVECSYYVRIFSKLPNFKFASGDTSNEYEIYKKDASGNSMLSIYQGTEYEFENHLSKLAFAKNIYSDGIGEVVFTDDIDLSNIKDNLGRPLTSLYLTVIKNNMGYKEWYGSDMGPNQWSVEDIRSERVEYSHCFGKITCGLETSYESKYDTSVNSINRIANNYNGNAGYIISDVINPKSSYICDVNTGETINIAENEVWYGTHKHFYGDLCCYDNYNAIEEPIQQVMHRFNTAQRESFKMYSKNYFNVYKYDEIELDDYDSTNGDSYRLVDKESKIGMNALHEGYYYAPHYEIRIKTFDKLQTAIPMFLTIRQMQKLPSSSGYQIVTLQQHFLSVGDKAMIYDKEEDKYYDCVAISGTNDNYKVFTCRIYEEGTTILKNDFDTTTLSRYKLFKLDNISVPSYATLLRDGTCRFIWRDVVNNGFNKSDSSVEEYPFTNGAFYVNKKIDIYVRRQDPHGRWGLYDKCDIEGELMDISNENNYVKENEIVC